MKVALVGTAPGSRLMAPFDDQDWEIWVCSAGNSQASALPRVTKWFELHAICDMTGAENKGWSLPYYSWLRSQNFPIYMQEKNDLVPQAIVFPHKMLCETFGPNKRGMMSWFTSSIAWMWAFALTQMREGDEIGIFGVDMAALEEAYTAQKAALHRFMEFSHERGVKVSIPYESCLGQHLPLYGYAEATPMGRKLAWRHHEIATQKSAIEADIQNKLQQRAFFDGALEGVKYDIRTWVSGTDVEFEGEHDATFMEAMRQKAEQIGKPVMTKDFIENGQGVFVPQGQAAAPPAEPDETVTVDPTTGRKHYGMRAAPARFGMAGNKRDPNGQALKE
jgi:hypothetical protein